MIAIHAALAAGLPEDTTHVRVGKPYWVCGAFFSRIEAFKYEKGTLMVHIRDSDDEYPQWAPATAVFTQIPEVVPL